MDEFISEDMKLAVKRGAVWMDENYSEWVGAIDLNRFEMNKCDRCIIGQAVGAYYNTIEEGAMAAGLCPSSSPEWAVEHGFDIIGGDSMSEEESQYNALEALWTDEVRKRRS